MDPVRELLLRTRVERWGRRERDEGMAPVRPGRSEKMRVARKGKRAMAVGMEPERVEEPVMRREMTRLVEERHWMPVHSQQAVSFAQLARISGLLKDFLMARRALWSPEKQLPAAVRERGE